jgi:hypothetical protein
VPIALIFARKYHNNRGALNRRILAIQGLNLAMSGSWMLLRDNRNGRLNLAMSGCCEITATRATNDYMAFRGFASIVTLFLERLYKRPKKCLQGSGCICCVTYGPYLLRVMILCSLLIFRGIEERSNMIVANAKSNV